MTQVCPHCHAVNRDSARFCAQCSQPLRLSCPHCGADNPARSRFCNKCGKSMTRDLHCPQCGRVNPAGSRFCNSCGAALSPTPPQAAAPPAQVPTAMETGALPPQSILSGRYVILHRIGRGGMGAVYQAADTRIPGKTWAIKEMSDAAITNPLEKKQVTAAFRQEALMLARLDHTNLPKVTDHFTEEGKQYLVMDFIAGETLAERLEQASGKPLSVDKVQELATQLCEVLRYLHSQDPPVIFRDLKPENVMVTPDGTVKLIDFGIARLFKPGKATDTAFFGTTGYAPKEQYGEGQTDARTDIYALGATLHHLLTGVSPTARPFEFVNIRQINSDVPPQIAETVMKALADDPADRWQSAVEMREALTQATIEEPPTQQVPEDRPRSRKRPKVSPLHEPAAAAAQANNASMRRPVSAPAVSRLNLWNGLGLALLGALLHGGLAGLTTEALSEYLEFPQAAFAFIPTLFGVLFGPWVGGFSGAMGSLAWHALSEWYWPDWKVTTLSAFTLGFVSGLMVKNARNWKAAFRAGILSSAVYALVVPTAIGVLEEWWSDFLYITVQVLIPALPFNLLLLPLFSRWLVGPVRRRGLYWQER